MDNQWYMCSVAVHPSVVEEMSEEERDNVLLLTIKFLNSQHPQIHLKSNYKYVEILNIKILGTHKTL